MREREQLHIQNSLSEKVNSINSEIEANYDDLSYLSLEEFLLLIENWKYKSMDFFELTEKELEKVKITGTNNSVSTLSNASNKVKEFVKKDKLYFNEITPTWLNDFNRYFIADGKSESTVQIYLRYIRKMFNIAIDLKIV